MTRNERRKVVDRVVKRAISKGWTEGEQYLVMEETDELLGTLNNIVFEAGFGRAFWGEEMIILRDIKTTRGQTVSEEAFRFHQHIILDFLQLAREDLAYEYLQEFLN